MLCSLQEKAIKCKVRSDTACGDLLDELLCSDSEDDASMESEDGSGMDVGETLDAKGNKVFIQVGGAPKKRKSVDDEGFKLTAGYSSKVQRVRFIDEEIRGKKYRMESSSAECSVFDEVVNKVKDLVDKSKDNPKGELRIKQLVDLTMPFIDSNLGEVLLLKDCCDRLVRRSMEAVIVNLFGVDDGSISWEKLYETMTKEPKTRKKRGYNSFTGHAPPNDNDDDDDDDDDDEDGGDDEEMPPLEHVSISTPKKRARTP